VAVRGMSTVLLLRRLLLFGVSATRRCQYCLVQCRAVSWADCARGTDQSYLVCVLLLGRSLLVTVRGLRGRMALGGIAVVALRRRLPVDERWPLAMQFIQAAWRHIVASREGQAHW